jgi:predicted nucleotide-binding protein (sugar kinase/HSP70/actin superfamily)
VGLPAALLYYQYYPLWKTFFEELGAEVVTSQPTSRAILTAGSARVVAETCLPVKVYCGHVLDLVDKCDCIFIPAIRSIQKNVYNCSKFLGLPDLIRAVIPECPPIIDVDIDVSKGKSSLHPSTYRIEKKIPWKAKGIKQAAQRAWEAHLEYTETMHRLGLTPLELLNGQRAAAPAVPESPGLKIALVGHPYNIYDEFITHRILRRLRGMGVMVVTPEMAGRQALEAGVVKVVGRPYWTYEDEIVGAGGHYLEGDVDGVIVVVSFGCGPDSTMMDVVQRFARHSGTRPLLTLTIDEHTGEAGLVTRLEAFLDMIERRRRNR